MKSGLLVITMVFLMVMLSVPNFSQEKEKSGILSFNFHDIYFAAHILRSKGQTTLDEYKDDITGFQNYMEEVSKTLYESVMNMGWNDIRPDYISTDKFEKIKPFLSEATQAESFQKLLSVGQDFAMSCKGQWEKNYEKSFKAISDVTGLPLGKTAFTVYFTHPGIKNSILLENNLILWGMKEDWDNFATASLWSEILKYYVPKDTISHAVIDILCYNYLRSQLNGGEYPAAPDGDPNKEVKDKVFPEWKTYLASAEKKDILKFIEQVKLKFK